MRGDRFVACGFGIAAQKKGGDALVLPANVDHAVRNPALMFPVEENVAGHHSGRTDRRQDERVAVVDGGAHARAAGAKAHTKAVREQLRAGGEEQARVPSDDLHASPSMPVQPPYRPQPPVEARRVPARRAASGRGQLGFQIGNEFHNVKVSNWRTQRAGRPFWDTSDIGRRKEADMTIGEIDALVAPQFPMVGVDAPDDIRLTPSDWLAVVERAIAPVGDDHVIRKFLGGNLLRVVRQVTAGKGQPPQSAPRRCRRGTACPAGSRRA